MGRHRTLGVIVAGAVLLPLAIALAVETHFRRSDPSPWPTSSAPRPGTPGMSQGQTASLYCEFNNFADLTPLVGFLFRVERVQPAPTFALILQREQDGSQAKFGGAGEPSLLWTFDRTDTQPAIRAPEEDLRINLYGYDTGRIDHAWFEAGLRSIRYKNLGGRCRQGG